MKKLIFLIILLILSLSFLAAQGAIALEDDKVAIKQAALNYAEGYYEGDAVRMEKALNPNLCKRGLIFSPRNNTSYLQQMNAPMLIEGTRSGRGKLAVELRQIDYQLLDISDSVAAARIFTAKFKDFLHLVKQNGQWRIVNVLWRPPVNQETVNKEDEKEAIRTRLEEFREAMRKGNSERVEGILHPALMLQGLTGSIEPGKAVLSERNADYFIDRTRAAAMGTIPEFRIAIQDVYEDIAAARLTMAGATLYLHLARQNGEWRILNMLQGPLASTPQPIGPVALGSRMPDFILPSFQGKDVSSAKLRGRNVLLIFPRGRVDDHWCQICHYQYAELAELEKRLQLRKKYDLDILFVLPYGRATVEHWVSIFPEQMDVIEKWKNPGDPAKISPGEKRWMETVRTHFPKKFVFNKDNVPTPFPILIDGERTVSRGLDLFTLAWDNSKVEQNIPAVYLLDRQGNVRFKYLSQNTMDRPSGDYLLEILNKFTSR